SGDSLTSQVINKYIEQETIERAEINFTPKQLSEMATEHFEKKRMQPALDAIEQALRLTPNNIKLTMSLLKILIMIKQSNEFASEHKKLGDDAIEMLLSSKVKGSGLAAIEKLNLKWTSAEHTEH
ncbi:MAG: hypothetical protein HRT53_01940, partial [Colwellia sp.]|nr:hypothetical protein [Colwellia sp.]